MLVGVKEDMKTMEKINTILECELGFESSFEVFMLEVK